MQKYFVVLGGNKLLWGQVCHLQELGYRVIVVAWNDNPDIKGDLFIQLDVKDSVGILQSEYSVDNGATWTKFDFSDVGSVDFDILIDF